MLDLRGARAVFEQLEHAKSFRQQGAQLRVVWVLLVDLIENLIAPLRAIDKPNLGQQRKLPLHGPHTRFDLAGNLTNIEGFIRCAKKQRQHPASGLAKEQIAGGCGCRSHNKNNCTLNEYNRQPDALLLP